MFEQEFEKFLKEQQRTASGQRLELLNKDLTGEKKLLKEVLWPVFKTFEGLTLEHELTTSTGFKIHVDITKANLGLAFEYEGYAVHAENITRERFTFEKSRVRTINMHGYRYIPFTHDEVDKKPDLCRRAVYELIGKFTSRAGAAMNELSVYEREVLRYTIQLNRPFRLEDVCYCLQKLPTASRVVIGKLIEKKLIVPINKGSKRFHEYALLAKAFDYML